MNKFFPLPILAALLGAFLALAHFASAYAQQYDSPASARKLEANAPMSLTLSAYATEYFYFSLPNTGKVIPTITLSDSAKIHIQLHDSRETSLKYVISPSHVITFQSALSGGERYFLKLSSTSSQDKKLKITLRCTEKAKESAKSKESASSKSKTSTKAKESASSKSKTSTKVGSSAKVKSSKTSNTAANSKSRTSAKTKSSKSSNATADSNSKAKLNSSKSNAHSRTQINSIKSEDTKKPGGTEIPAPKPTTTVTKTPTPKKSTNSHTTNPNSKSNLSLSTHFLRTKAGTSLAIAEALNLSEESSALSYRCIFSDRISIQNGILYSKTPGIAVIEITGDHFKSSCTICIK